MALITLSQAELAYGLSPLLNRVDFSLETRERVGLIGRNGTGKSSLLRILANIDQPDAGLLQYQQGLKIAYVAQDPDLPDGLTVFDAVAQGFDQTRRWIEDFSSGIGDLNELQAKIELNNGWNWEQIVNETVGRLHLEPTALLQTLSGGNLKRVALGQALVQMPDVLFLDEPTNHLDMDSIHWLEELLVNFKGSLVTITHDRRFLDRIATRIIELDRGKLSTYPGNFSAYKILKDEQLLQEATIQAKADKLLAAEEVWIRKGVEARRTRSQSRINRLEALREQRSKRREVIGKVNLGLDRGEESGKLVAELIRVSKSFQSGSQAKQVLNEVSLTVLRGDKIGLIGPNGAGKSTLLKIILGEMAADQGHVRLGSRVSVAYFDQHREALDLEATLEDFISPGSEWIEIGQRRQHVKSYLSDFLFSPARANAPVKSLSGGERNRLLLARLFAKPSNVIVLDEPTNDLDIETLELLETLIQEFTGTVFIVSHDRAFLEEVVTSTLVFEGNGHWREYEGGVQDWLTQSQRSLEFSTQNDKSTSQGVVPADKEFSPERSPIEVVKKSSATSRKLSYKEQRELESLPGKIEQLETEQSNLRVQLSDPDIYIKDPLGAAALHQRDAAIDEELMICLERWEALGSS
jgi:ATP-binding cassette subfamily F protein uup